MQLASVEPQACGTSGRSVTAATDLARLSSLARDHSRPIRMAHNAQDTERAEKSYWGDGILEEDQKKLDNASKSKDELVLESPIRLGYFAIFCLVVNRMVGKFR